MKQVFGQPLAGAALLAVGLLGVAAPASRAATAFNEPGDVKSITSIEDALATQTHMKDLIGYYAPNAFVEDMTTPGIYQGRKQIAAAFDSQFVPVKSMKSDILDMNIASDGKFACAALRVKFDMAMKDGSNVTVSTRQLDAFKKLGGKWQIVQEHISVPMDQKTGMAVMNGTLPVRGPVDWSDNPFPGPATTPAQAKDEIHHWLIVGAPVVDVNDMLNYLGPDNEAVLYDLTAPGEYRGLKEIHDAYAPLMNSLSSANDQLLKFIVDSDGSFGVQIDTQNLKINFKDGTSKIISFRQSDCMHRMDGKWRSFFEMLSFPVDPKTGKSVSTDPTASFK